MNQIDININNNMGCGCSNDCHVMSVLFVQLGLRVDFFNIIKVQATNMSKTRTIHRKVHQLGTMGIHAGSSGKTMAHIVYQLMYFSCNGHRMPQFRINVQYVILLP